MDDETTPNASATGILQCLRMLAAEAAVLRLERTFIALRDAVRACEAEVLAGKLVTGSADGVEALLPATLRLH
ncbi:MAG: hypothetical protein JO209_02065 [Acidisphaera sp.]|nr:hypothetical protein [Acidisphaera sp.]